VQRYRFVARPGWLVLHVFTIATIVTMVLLGRWQLTVSDEKHFSLQNFGYAIQWWLFSACAVLMWGRLIRDQARRGDGPSTGEIAEPAPSAEAPVAYRRYVMPKVSDAPADPVHAAYNDYLAALAAQDAAKEGR
jgi:DNA-binding transcriptional regulator of glucitol operon